jgi:antirestriction protein
MPKIYAACIASYNRGRLHGEWIDAERDADAIREDIDTMLAASPCKGAVEWAIHDYDDMVELGEYPNLEKVSEVAKLVARRGVAVTQYALDNYDSDSESAGEYIEENYLGQYGNDISDTEIDAVIAMYEDNGECPEDELPEWAKPHRDAIMRDKAEDAINGGAFVIEYETAGVYHIYSN